MPDLRAILVVTTDKVYRNDGGGRAFRETDPLSGADPYSASKVGQEMAAQAYGRSYFEPAGVPLATAAAATSSAEATSARTGSCRTSCAPCVRGRP